MLELKYRDAMGRICLLDFGKGKVLETPAILPVISPKVQQVSTREIKEMGFQGVITNSYIIYRDAALREKALKKGVHKLIGFDDFVMTDSGSYQLYGYGKVEIAPEEIVRFQAAIGSDMGVILDIPTPPDAPRDKAEADVKETLKRAEKALDVKGDMPLAGTVQGSTYPELREEAAKGLSKLPLDLYPIGGVVPLMGNYRFADLARVVLHSKKHLPLEKPVHLFGCGHPMVFAFAVALGCDLFDSAAYALYAEDDRYITPDGTLRLSKLYEFPCSCEVCTQYSPKELRELDKEDRVTLLSRHNLSATMQELRRVKQSIHDGSLWELVERRGRSHPYLLDGLKAALEYPYIEEFDPITKGSAFFYSGAESLRRPEVVRHLRRLKEIEFKAEKLALLPWLGKPYSKLYGTSSNLEYHVCVASPVFGIIPLELEEVYPLSQHEAPTQLDSDQRAFMRTEVKKYSEAFQEVYVHKDLKGLEVKGERFEDASFGKGDDEVKLRAIADYQFGRGAGKMLIRDVEVERARNGRIRRIHSKGELLATLRASDGILVPTAKGAERLLKMTSPKNRVVVRDDITEFVRDGKSVFAKFVSMCDLKIRPYQEVLVVDKEDALLATGRAILNGREMLAFERGIAVKVRHKGDKEHEGLG
ncbi:MAG: tRNA guanosine(15) transglycosylase TgtA [Candidatus Hydrothermarchaeales archaeon]